MTSYIQKFNPNTWSDFDIELNNQTDGDITKDYDVEAIRNSLQNICTTLQGSRRMLPDFATDIQYLLFEPISQSTARLIANHLIDAINRWDNRVKLTGFNIVADPDNNSYECNITFYIQNIQTTSEVQTISFVLKQI